MICTSSLDSASQEVVRNFSALLNNVAGLKTECIVEEEKREKNIVFFDLDTSIADEGYSLDIDPSKIIIKASSAAGFYYAVQSLKQLLPIAVYGDKKSDSVEEWEVPCAHIDDAPRFSYRGMHLDVARHFFSVDEVKRYIDLLAMHKLNVFHWHLTDDQGWRIEIKKYPKLTESAVFANIRWLRKILISMIILRMGDIIHKSRFGILSIMQKNVLLL